MAKVNLIKDGSFRRVTVGSDTYKRLVGQGYAVDGGGSLKTTTSNTGSTSGSTQTSSGGSKTRVIRYNGQEYPSLEAAYAARDATSGTTTRTSAGQETVEDTVARAKALLGSAYDPTTPAPDQQRMQEIASQPFIRDEVRRQYQASLPRTTAPTNIGQVSPFYQPTNIPSITPPSGDISFATAGTAGLQGQAAVAQDFYNQKLAAEQTRQEEKSGLLQSFLDNVTSPAEAREQAIADSGFDFGEYYAAQERGFKEIESLSNEYNRTVEAKDQQIAQTQDKLASNNFINNQVAQIERNAAPKLNRLSAEINAKAAILQAQQGNFAEAQKYINQAVDDATAETKFQYDMYALVAQENEDNFSRIQSIYTEAYNASMALAQIEYEQDRADKEAIGNLMLEYPSAGIDIYNDTLDEAYRKAGLVPPQVAGGSGGAGGGFTLSSRTQQVLDGFTSLTALTPTEAAKVRDELYAQGFGSDEPPEWYVEYLQDAWKQSILPSVVKEEWIKYRDQVMQGGTAPATTGGGSELPGFDEL